MIKEIFNEKSVVMLLIFIIVAYLFSIGVRAYWPIYFGDISAMNYSGQLMINTNDGYYFASGAKDILNEIIPKDRERLRTFSYGLTTFTAYVTKILPFSLETVILYLSSVISSLIVIPIILLGRLIGHTFLGFLSALIGSIAWSYYNRTMVGYYDSDMFAIFLQFMIFYSFIYIVYTKTLRAIVFSAILIFIYPYFYPQGLSITYAMFFILLLYLIMEYKGVIKVDETNNFKKNRISLYTSVILLSIPLMLMLPIYIRVTLFILAFIVLQRIDLKERQLLYISIVFFIAYLIFGNIIGVLTGKLMGYVVRGVETEGLHFYQVTQTVREAGTIPWTTVANRISGSSVGLILSLVGYIVLVWRHKPFIIALPLIGVGIFAHIGGLRFTVYAVPIMAISVVYLFWVIGSLFKEKILRYIFVIFATGAMLYPNIAHVIAYTVPTVMNKSEVNDLVKLNKISDRKDYTLAWWDYGYPIWFYSDTSTLIDGGKHHHDNYIVSKIMFSTSPQQVANLSRLAIETYIDSNYSTVADVLFHNKKETQKDPQKFMEALKEPNYKLPPKTREVFLYMPYRMMNIFPTVGVFSNLNLKTGKKQRNIIFYPTSIIKQNGTQIIFENGIIFDFAKGVIRLGQNVQKVYRFDQVRLDNNFNPKVKANIMHLDGNFCIVSLESYGRVIIMDKETYNSAFVQMFMLGNYDKNLFELVVSSPYSKIYRVKK